MDAGPESRIHSLDGKALQRPQSGNIFVLPLTCPLHLFLRQCVVGMQFIMRDRAEILAELYRLVGTGCIRMMNPGNNEARLKVLHDFPAVREVQ